MRGKGIVVEISGNNRVIVLTSQGEFIRVSFNKPVSVGQEIQFNKKRRPSFWHWSVAAVVLVALVGSASIVNDALLGTNGNGPTYFVTLDINPSVELAVNQDRKVISAEGLNLDGENLLNKVNVVGRDFKEVVQIISRQAEVDGYLKSGENEVVVTISSPDNQETQVITVDEFHLRDEDYGIHYALEDIVVEQLTTVYQATVQVWQVPINVRQEAKAAGISPAHYVEIQIETKEMPAKSQAQGVTTTLERQGEVRVFEFQVQRPVLTAETWTREDSRSGRGGFNPLALLGSRAKGDQDSRE